MPHTAALVPAPFYAPVRTDAAPLPTVGERARSPGRLRFSARRPPRVDADDGLIYRRDGCLVGDGSVGRRVNLYV